jgi:hypothetical protein
LAVRDVLTTGPAGEARYSVGTRIKQLQVLKDIALKVVDFISHLED